jgi:hypothetical protein
MSDTPSATTTVAAKEPDVLINAVKLGGDTIIAPGVSQLLDGHVISGAIHAVVGVGLRVALGPVVGTAAWFLTAANSYALSSTNQNLLQLGQAAAQGASRGVREASQGARPAAVQSVPEASVSPATEEAASRPRRQKAAEPQPEPSA